MTTRSSVVGKHLWARVATSRNIVARGVSVRCIPDHSFVTVLLHEP
ncbi:MAG: hypothetical protein ACU0CQ_10385 [Sulfitobacter sp.]